MLQGDTGHTHLLALDSLLLQSRGTDSSSSSLNPSVDALLSYIQWDPESLSIFSLSAVLITPCFLSGLARSITYEDGVRPSPP